MRSRMTPSPKRSNISVTQIVAKNENDIRGFKRLSGSLPPELAYLTGLTHLDLSRNLLVGTIPDALYDLTQLSESLSFQCRCLSLV